MKRLFVLLFLLFNFTVPVLAEETYYDAYPTLEDIIKSRKIVYFRHIPAINDDPNLVVKYNQNGQIISFGKFKFQYNDDGTYNKICGEKVTYNKKGQIEKIGHKKVTYNEQGQIIKVGRFNVSYKNNGDLDYFCGFINFYKATYKYNDTLNLPEFYEEFLTDKFFNTFKYNVEKFQHYFGLESIIIKRNVDASATVNKYVHNIDFFKKLYNEYIENGYISDKYDEEWFMTQVKDTEDWMKTHKIGYENPYLEHYRKKDLTPKTKEEILQEELENLREQKQQLRNSIEQLQNKQEELQRQIEENKIRYINGKYVQYNGNGYVRIND